MFRFLLGVAAGALATLLLDPRVAERVRPAAKAAMKSAMKVYRSAQVAGAELAEAAEDLMAEVRVEADEEEIAGAAATAAAHARTAEKTPGFAQPAEPGPAAPADDIATYSKPRARKRASSPPADDIAAYSKKRTKRRAGSNAQ